MKIKKLFLTILFTTSVLCLNAQKKGDISLGLSAGISYTDATSLSKTTISGNTDNNSIYSFGVSASPEIGYFIVNNLKISLSGGYALQSERKEGRYGGVEPKMSTGVFSVGPSISYYLKVARGLYFTPEFGAFYAFGTTNQRDLSFSISGSVFDPRHKTATVDVSEYSAKLHGFELAASLIALEYKPSDRIGIAVSFSQIEYVSLSGEVEEKNISIDSQTIGFRMNTSAVVGLRFYL